MNKIVKYLLYLIILLAAQSIAVSCHTTKRTVQTYSDTLVRLRHVEVPYDTTVKIVGHAVQYIAQVAVAAGKAQLRDTVIKQGRIVTHVSIKDGVLQVDAAVADTAVQVKGTARAIVADTTINNTKVITVEHKRTWFGKVMDVIKNSFLIILVLAALILCYIFLPAIKRLFKKK